MSWIDDLLIMDVAWKGNATLAYADTKANVAYYDSANSTIYLINLSNTANYQSPHNDFLNFEDVFTNESGITFRFEDYEWVIYYEPKVYGDGNVTLECVGTGCYTCGKTLDECDCTLVPESPGCGLKPGDIIYQIVPEIRTKVVLTPDEFFTLMSTTYGLYPDKNNTTEAQRTIYVVTQEAKTITAQVVQEIENDLTVSVKHATAKFVPGYPIGKMGQPPCVVVNIVYLEFDYFFGGYIIQEPGMHKADCFWPCGPRNIPAEACLNLGPLEDAAVWCFYRETPTTGVRAQGFGDDYYIIPNPAATVQIRALNNPEPLTPIGYMTEAWTNAQVEYVSIGMNVDRLRYNLYSYEVSA